MFQSLIGFKINWNEDHLIMKKIYRLFQSLIGFKINWNVKGLEKWKVSEDFVSIPNRV